MRKCPNCYGTTIKKPTTVKKSENSSRIITIVGKKTPIGGKKTKI